jgi:hypothetical protein
VIHAGAKVRKALGQIRRMRTVFPSLEQRLVMGDPISELIDYPDVIFK